MKKHIIVVTVALVLTGALAQDTSNVETRLSIVESRLGRLEADVSRLSSVPTSLARIEEKLTALSEKANGNSGIIMSVGLGIVMTALGSALSYDRGKKNASQ